MKILGVDPGTNRIGYGLIEENKGLKLLDYGVLEIKKSANIIKEAADRFRTLLKNLAPELIAIEKIYFSKNQKTALDVSQTRGVLILQCLESKIPIVEYGPMEVKQGVTGYGLSDKKAVATMVKRFLNVDKLEGYDDASDALAIAITAANHLKLNRA